MKLVIRNIFFTAVKRSYGIGGLVVRGNEYGRQDFIRESVQQARLKTSQEFVKYDSQLKQHIVLIDRPLINDIKRLNEGPENIPTGLYVEVVDSETGEVESLHFAITRDMISHVIAAPLIKGLEINTFFSLHIETLFKEQFNVL